eukprot:GHVL01021699.1.p1 GENE.GHVL01021699.1~~GHVL01021699.1.p1  ORF type:complete len:125 (+),score=32.69 GHVL01021699.1:201-575(+)
MPETKNIVYSGDTRPCVRLAEAANSCEVLIHEATLDDSLQQEAETKKHSTWSEAINIGKMSGAKNLILTHFSQRYPKAPQLDMSNNIIFALDLMEIPIAAIEYLTNIYIKIQKIIMLLEDKENN